MDVGLSDVGAKAITPKPIREKTRNKSKGGNISLGEISVKLGPVCTWFSLEI
jgi:hypothetical protein